MINSEPPWWLYGLIGAFFAALTTIFAKIGIESVNANLANAIRTVVILAMAWSIVLFQGQAAALPEISVRNLIFLGFSGLSTGLSWFYYFKALQLGPASLVAPLDKTGVVFVVLFSAVFLHEPLTLQSSMGAVLILAGTLLFVL
ncbi:MAG: EamA family transporter [Acaryochloridaceae cyanobacterium SU_2_1]|nr:EamA family transporter [Acaryochloridaceae cyanobacterium SU_2_1]